VRRIPAAAAAAGDIMRKVLEDGFGWEKRIGIGKNTGGN
jgi:hypothetical protein